MAKFVEFERLELDDKTITLQIRNVKWGTVIEEQKRFLERANKIEYNIAGLRIMSVDCPALECNYKGTTTLYLQGQDLSSDNRIVTYKFSAGCQAIEIYEALLSIATNETEILKKKNKQYIGNSETFISYDDITKIAFRPFDYKIDKEEIEKSIEELREEQEKISLPKGTLASSLYRAYYGMDWGSADDGKTCASNKEKAEENKTKGEEKMKIIERKNLTVAEALGKFELEKAYLHSNTSRGASIGYYGSDKTVVFGTIEDSNILETKEYNKDTRVETTYVIAEAKEFIQKLNALKPFNKMVSLEKYAEKPKFVLGDKVIYRRTDVIIGFDENDYPEDLKKQILENRIKKTEQKGIITGMEYYGDDNKINYTILTTNHGGIIVGAENLSKVAE